MIQVHFPGQSTPMDFPDADFADVASAGHLKLFKRTDGSADVLLGAVAPGWSWYVIVQDDPPAQPDPEPADEPPAQPAPGEGPVLPSEPLPPAPTNPTGPTNPLGPVLGPLFPGLHL